MATALLPNSDLKVVSVNPISDQIRRLQVISCDMCNAANASYDVFVDGVIREVTLLKRCCEKCVQSSFSQ